MTNIRDDLYDKIEKDSGNIIILDLTYRIYAVYDSKENLIKIYKNGSRKSISLDFLDHYILLATIDNDNVLTIALKDGYIKEYHFYIRILLVTLSYSYPTLYYRLAEGYSIFKDNIGYEVQLISNKPIHKIEVNTEALPLPGYDKVQGAKFSLKADEELYVKYTVNNITLMKANEKSCVKYIDGNITCVTDPKALEEIEFILLYITFLTYIVNSKYNLMMYSINHKYSNLSRFRYRATSFRLKNTRKRVLTVRTERLLSKYYNERPLSKYHYSRTRVNQASKQTVKLERLIDQWLDRYKLYTEEKYKYSYYLVDLKNLDPLTVAKVVANKELKKIYNI